MDHLFGDILSKNIENRRVCFPLFVFCLVASLCVATSVLYLHVSTRKFKFFDFPHVKLA